MSFKLNPFTGQLDITESLTNLSNLLDSRYLKIDQTVPQTIINGAPEFGAGASVKAGQKFVLDAA